VIYHSTATGSVEYDFIVERTRILIGSLSVDRPRTHKPRRDGTLVLPIPAGDINLIPRLPISWSAGAAP